MNKLLEEIRNCTICLPHLEHGVNPVLAAHKKSRIAIVGQAPGSVVHQTGVPWDDKSGDRLRQWLGLGPQEFYAPELVALIPMGFCYPGKGKSGDLPPRKECAATWHDKLFKELETIELTILIGSYAQKHYLKKQQMATLTETVKNFRAYLPHTFVLPHPSPRNNIWMKKNPWFESELLPELKKAVAFVVNAVR
ncbi:uracil-DNA glycosylase family protein [Fulvivirga sp. 29W222]|uniref:Uracil-DNA glycosylase family protein n=1 Tax=Fulvivirga marina TaxID=2494733 RepID=A0A937KCB9_9BACT|nr:uracil-DNA glycosylase family protein [Fulvivirga marina]MBL6445083.1 uracil-DNA glycosylase family protein [Fulvivirga marina]